MEHIPSTLLWAASAALACSSIFLLQRHRKRPSYPPGPRGYPVIGNLLDVPSQNSWLTYAAWSRDYRSDIIHFQIFNDHVVVVNTAAAASELFDKKSALYSDRPWLTMLNDLCGYAEWNVGFMPYGNAWRTIRAQFHQTVGPEKLLQWRTKQTHAVRTYLKDLFESPEDFFRSTSRFIGFNILNVTYGIQSDVDRWVDLAESSNRVVAATVVPGSFLVDAIPLLKYIPEWFPGARFKRQAREWQSTGQRVRDEPFDYTKQILADGSEDLSITALLLQPPEGPENIDRELEEVSRRTTAIMYGAGAETSVSAIETFFLAMTLSPDVQARAHEELEPIIQQGRLPSLSDELPYISAIVKECLRWGPVLPLSLPHRLMQDDIAFGYFIPKGTTVIGNAWAILHDETAYPDPSSFKPRRFLGRDPNPDPTVAFGFGRRICPGRFFALENLAITFASVLACFDIKKALNVDGSVHEPEVEYSSGFLSHPKPFRCEISPRSANFLDLIRSPAID